MSRLSMISAILALGFIVGCGGTAVEQVDSSFSETMLIPPKVSKSDENGIKIRYAEVTLGFKKVPQNILDMAKSHCASHDKNAFWMKNKRSWMLGMTLGIFECRDD